MFLYVGWPFRVVVVLLDLLLETHGFTVSAKLQLVAWMMAVGLCFRSSLSSCCDSAEGKFIL